MRHPCQRQQHDSGDGGEEIGCIKVHRNIAVDGRDLEHVHEGHAVGIQHALHEFGPRDMVAGR